MSQTMHFYMDTHDKSNGTFPEGITPEGLAEFYKQYEKACEEEGVISLKIHVGFNEGRAFCLNMAPSISAVFNVHQKVGLPFDTITEVSTISPADLLRK
ncbi:DUF4242 domain-containing protein [Sulfuricurvum sp.]|uniref:DUF4242 domain-containing protein n=1 Tax=Sulfuricurvum sp. TaxID=2025608 RepID=UPI00260DE5EC|nr:DUF4242 domain-containing protein [Sulfuricurvum sp.]MDD3596978.1 DUF4242 domain-containing protein [Sulfuricurvum sp.]MDD4884406.1 DUF4242 domain-containing protein [Sulfuricurvum sp.]